MLSMELEAPLKVGFLFIPPHKLLRKAWLKRYCALYNASNHGIQRIELFESEDAFAKQSSPKIIPLTDCWKVSPLPQKHQPNVFEVRTKTDTYQFSAETFQEMSEWLASLQSVAFNKSSAKAAPFSPINKGKHEENMLYCSMDEPEIFQIKVAPTEAAIRNNLKGEYKLIVTTVNFSISDNINFQGRMGPFILTWPFRHIRRYGCGTESFSFEAGRKCLSGEGLFVFTSNDGLKIFQSIDNQVAILKSTQGGMDYQNSPLIREDKSMFFSSKDSFIKYGESIGQRCKYEETPVISNTSEDILGAVDSLKPMAPFKKPPRKSKPSVADCGQIKTSATNCPMALEFEDNYNIILTEKDFDVSPESPVSPYAQVSLYSEVASSDIASQPFDESKFGKKMNNHISDELGTNSCVENMKKMELSKKDLKQNKTIFANNSDNCGLVFDATPQLSAAGHVYGKISSPKQSGLSGSSNFHTSIRKNSNSDDSIPLYSNLMSLNETSIASLNESRQDPEHFIINDAEYARVLKKK